MYLGLVKCWLPRWLLLGDVMWTLISSLYHSEHAGHHCPDILGPVLCCSIKQLGYYVLNWLVLLLIMPSCCKGGWMATHLTCITTVPRTHQPPPASIQQSPSVNIQLGGIRRIQRTLAINCSLLNFFPLRFLFLLLIIIWIGQIMSSATISSPLQLKYRNIQSFSFEGLKARVKVCYVEWLIVSDQVGYTTKYH